MSKAFTREENDGPDIPDLPPLLSALAPGAKNYITAAGAQKLRDELQQLIEIARPSLASSSDDPEAKRQLARLDQRILQLEESLQSSEIITPPNGPADSVRFGATVTVRESDGNQASYRIVGVDETDIDRGWISWISPLAKALLNGKRGERIRFKFPSGEETLEILDIDMNNILLRLLAASFFLIALLPIASGEEKKAPSSEPFDVLIKGGTLYDGTGGKPRLTDVAIRGDRIAALGNLPDAQARTVIDAKGMAVAPGFINMLSWSTESLIEDGRSQSEIREGVTTEIMGEGVSMGPLNERMKERMASEQRDLKYEITWTTLAEYLTHLEKRGIAPNVASFLGATTVREYVIGLDDKAPTPQQLEEMRELVRRAMEDGALGIGSSLIYAPAFYAKTDELIELCKVAAKYQGKYISHVRSEGNQLIEAIDELIRISREAGLPAEVYHLKAAGEKNWPKMDKVLAKIEAARKEGLKITADMYAYPAAGTGLDATLPPWTLDGGYDALWKRLEDPATRKKIAAAVRAPSNDWENFYLAAGSPDRILLVGFKSEKLKPLTGKSLAEIARMRGTDPVDTIMDLLLEDRSRIDTIYFVMSEANIRKEMARPWVSFGSDEASQAPEGAFLKANPHPRAYGNFARVLGRYVREEKIISLPEAIRKLTGLPATNLGLDHRGFIQEGMFADVVIFDPAKIADRATFEKPHQYAVGMKHVFVNGVQVLKDGEHTGAKPGRALWGPGKGNPKTQAPNPK